MPDEDLTQRIAEPEEGDEEETEDEDASSPFDHPAFLPVLLLGFTVWFGYDGWFNPTIEAVTFNRVMAPVLLAAAIWDGYRTRRRILGAAAASEESA